MYSYCGLDRWFRFPYARGNYESYGLLLRHTSRQAKVQVKADVFEMLVRFS